MLVGNVQGTFDLEQLSYIAGHVTSRATKLEDPIPIRSWVTSYNVFSQTPLKMYMQPLHMRQITDQWVGGQKQLHFWNAGLWFAYSLYNFYWATSTIKGLLLSSICNAKALDSKNSLYVTL